MSNKNIEILDCTIRDGSYIVDGQWSPEEIGQITAKLAENKIAYIEVGSGIGLGATRKNVNSLCSDLEHICAAVPVKLNSKIGAFFIPGIGSMEDLEMLAENGGDFVRIGTDFSRYQEAIKYIEYAKKLGLEVGYNCMKSYVASPYSIGKIAVEFEKYGVASFSLVDSAGGMLPQEVAKYIEVLVGSLSIKVGFHGHNNLLLANANALAAANSGATIIDTTLMGMGRGAGNAQTESMSVILRKAGYKIDADPLELSRLSAEYISPKSSEIRGVDELQLTLGYAQFHDSYINAIKEIASNNFIDYRLLIMEVSKINKENPSTELMTKVAKDLKQGAKTDVFYPKFHPKNKRYGTS